MAPKTHAKSNIINKKIKEKYNLEKELNRIGMDPQTILLVTTDESAFALGLVKHFRIILDKSQVISTITKLKNLRDKAVAHNEQAAQIQGPTWQGLNDAWQTLRNGIRDRH